MPVPLLDCLVIGGGAAGLTAATYLARFRRRIEVIDGGSSRLLSIPTSHNYPGYKGGIHGHDLLDRLRAQVAEYDVRVTQGTVTELERTEDGNFEAVVDSRHIRARTVILATGVVDVEPPFPDVKQAVAQGCVRYCPICDGFEAIGKRVAVVGRGKNGLGEAIFVRHYADEVTLFSLDDKIRLTESERSRLEQAQVKAVEEPVAQLAFDHAGVMQIHLRDGSLHRFDVVYAALGTMVNSGLAQLLGAACNDDGTLHVDSHQQTTVNGLYAAGDIVAGLNQITVAMGQAAVAATAIHNRLRG